MGTSVSEVWEGLKNGASGVGYTSIFDASRFPTKIAAEVRNWDVSQAGLDPEAWKLRGRHTKFAAGAAMQAVRDSACSTSRSTPPVLASTWAAAKGSKISSASPA